MRSILRSRRTVGVAVVAGTLAVVASGSVAMASSESAAPARTANTAKLVPATPEGLLLTLLKTLPPGKTGHYAGNPAAGNSQLLVQTYLDRASPHPTRTRRPSRIRSPGPRTTVT